MADKSTFPDFCSELRERTRSVHDKSDKLINLKLAIALTDMKTYGHVLADFYFVFQSIENALEEAKENPHVGPLIFEELKRTHYFENDLAFYLGEDWKKTAQPSDVAKDYCARIMDITRSRPTLIVAYAHSMYLALLAGGQIIKKIIKKSLGLPSDDGLAIFTFSEGKHEVKRQFMENINQMDFTREDKEDIIKEKMRVFQMNNTIASNVKPSLNASKRLIKLIVLILLAILAILYLLARYIGIIKA